MSEDNVQYGYKKNIPEMSSVVITHDSWVIKLYKKKRQLTIETLEYHDGPLVLSRNDIVEIARKMGLHVRTRNIKRKDSIK